MPEPTLADLLEPAVRSPASQAVTPSHLGAAEKCAAVSIAISLKRLADNTDRIVEALAYLAHPAVTVNPADIVSSHRQPIGTRLTADDLHELKTGS